MCCGRGSSNVTEDADVDVVYSVDVVIVELLEDRQIFGGLLGVVQLVVPSLCGSSRAGRWLEVTVETMFLLLAFRGQRTASRQRRRSRSEAPIN
jgi:hypothetical protein